MMLPLLDNDFRTIIKMLVVNNKSGGWNDKTSGESVSLFHKDELFSHQFIYILFSVVSDGE